MTKKIRSPYARATLSSFFQTGWHKNPLSVSSLPTAFSCLLHRRYILARAHQERWRSTRSDEIEGAHPLFGGAATHPTPRHRKGLIDALSRSFFLPLQLLAQWRRDDPSLWHSLSPGMGISPCRMVLSATWASAIGRDSAMEGCGRGNSVSSITNNGGSSSGSMRVSRLAVEECAVDSHSAAFLGWSAFSLCWVWTTAAPSFVRSEI